MWALLQFLAVSLSKTTGKKTCVCFEGGEGSSYLLETCIKLFMDERNVIAEKCFKITRKGERELGRHMKEDCPRADHS